MPTLEITSQTNISELVADLPIAQKVLETFGLGCSGCSVNKKETIEQGAAAHGLRLEPILAALAQAKRSGQVPTIADEDRRPQKRAPSELARKQQIKHIVPIMSGKGGVGKSTVTAMLAVGLRRKNLRVGILDADITGPSIPRLFGLRQPLIVERDPNGVPDQHGQTPPLFVPVQTRSAIEVISSNLLAPEEDTAMVWRGPILSGVIRQFYEQTLWSELDYLLLDLPPGTSDAPLTVLQSLAIDGVVLVTMPQALATMIVRKAANLIFQLKRQVIGVVENMSYFVAPDTGKRYEIFGPSNADQVVALARAPMLARLPLDPKLMALADSGRMDEVDSPFVDELAQSLMDVMAKVEKPRETISII
jgi:hybrid cluster-associated redox disulfide protein